MLDAALKIVAVSADPSLTARCEQELQRRLGSEAWAARSNASYVDITHADANKGMVVRDVSRMFNIPFDEIATIGDMPNDIPMLTLAGVGIAMGNASEEVQSVARHVTTSNDDDGFANAVEHFILADRAESDAAMPLAYRVLRRCAGVNKWTHFVVRDASLLASHPAKIGTFAQQFVSRLSIKDGLDNAQWSGKFLRSATATTASRRGTNISSLTPTSAYWGRPQRAATTRSRSKCCCRIAKPARDLILAVDEVAGVSAWPDALRKSMAVTSQSRY